VQSMRQVTHPGAPLEPRILTQTNGEDAPGREFFVRLPAGEDIFYSLTDMLAAHGISTAGVRIIDGAFKAFSFCTGVPDPTGYRVATFSETKVPPCPVELIAGNIIAGLDEDGASKTHCHAVFVDRDGGQYVGHLLPGDCTIGPGGATVWVTDTGDACLQVRFDTETNFPIFHPASSSGEQKMEKNIEENLAAIVVEAGRFGRTLTARIRPNTDLVTGIESLCAENDISYGEIRGCVGSLMDATLSLGTSDATRIQEIEGPGLEIAIASGVVRPDASGTPRANLRGLVANGAGEAFAGKFVRGRNLVFVTLEVVLQEWLPEINAQ
jgi:predicted DNA-binding protein with PD1-like motif